VLLGIVTALPASADVVSGGALTSGTAVTATVNVVNRDIQYSFAGTLGAHVTFDVTASAWGAGNARLYIYRPGGTLYANCALTNAPSFCDFTPNLTGTWIATLDPQGASVGGATFTFANDQAKGALTAATAISTSISVKGQNAGYTFTGTSGLHSAFAVSSSSWSGEARLYFYNPGGTVFTYCTLSSTSASICDVTPNVTGTWKVVLDPTAGAVGSAAFAYANDQDKGALVSGTPITTSITGKGVNAKYTFAGINGVAVSLTVTAAGWGGGSARLYFFPPAGSPLYFSCVVTVGAPCDFTPNVTGTWKVQLDPQDATVGSTTFTYVSATDQDKGPLTVGTPISTSIAVSGQNAGYTFAGTTGVHKTIDVTATNWGSGEARLYVYDPSGTLYTYCNLGSAPTYCDFVPDLTGTWKLVLDPQGAAVGSTTFTLVNDQAKGALTANTPISTSITVKGQNANYTFAGTNGTPVTFDVTATNWGSGGATLYFYQPDGTLYTYCNFTTDPTQCYLTPNVTGTWKVMLDPYEASVGSTTFKHYLN
jgi:hypothetical protein